MWILSWLAMLVQICLLTLCIAAGLYYLAELVEEYTVMTKRVIKYLIVFVSCIYVGLIIFEGLPLKMTFTGIVSTLLYTALLPNFPDIDLVSPSFIATLILVFVNHYFAFGYFAEVSVCGRQCVLVGDSAAFVCGSIQLVTGCAKNLVKT